MRSKSARSVSAAEPKLSKIRQVVSPLFRNCITDHNLKQQRNQDSQISQRCTFEEEASCSRRLPKDIGRCFRFTRQTQSYVHAVT